MISPLLLNDPLRMDRKEISRRILDFTLEIISLLSGEDYTIVKKTSGGTPIIHESEVWTPIIEPLPLIHEKKILELNHKMIELLTGEVPVRCQDVAVYFSMEEWEYIEGHKDLYKDAMYKEAMMEAPRPLTSPVKKRRDGSRRRNPPKRCPRPLYSQDCPEEKLPENHQDENIIKIQVKDESEEETDLRGDQKYRLRLRKRNPPERCPRPLYSQDCSEEQLPENNQDENMIDIKVEVIDEEEEETDLWGDHQYAIRERNTPERCPRTRTVQDFLEERVQENHEMTNQMEDLTIIKVEDEEDWMMGDPPCMSDEEEDDPVHVTTETPSKNSKRKIMLPIKYEEDDEDITQCSSRENDITCNVHPEPPSTDPSYNPSNDEEPSPDPDRSQITTNPDLSCNLSNHEEPSPDQSQIVTTDAGPEVDTKSECDEDEKPNTKVSGLFILRRSPLSETSYICSHCGKSFTNKAYLLAHQRNHRGEKPYICSECGKCFIYKSQFANHERSHTGEKPYACSECGKCYTNKSALIKHHRSHTGEKPYSCPQCGKRFITRTRLTDHYRIHSGEKPYSCSICGKCFTQKSNLVRHEKIHTKEIRTEEDSNFEIL